MVASAKAKGRRIALPTKESLSAFVARTKVGERVKLKGPNVFIECRRFQFEADGVQYGARIWIKEVVNEKSKLLYEDTLILNDTPQPIHCEGFHFKINRQQFFMSETNPNQLHFKVDGDLCFSESMILPGQVSAFATSITFLKPHSHLWRLCLSK